MLANLGWSKLFYREEAAKYLERALSNQSAVNQLSMGKRNDTARGTFGSCGASATSPVRDAQP